MTDNLAQKTVKGAMWSVGSQAITVLVSLLTTSILARMVEPNAFGMIAMIAAFFGIGEMVRDFGLTNAVIQAPKVSREEKNNLFWFNSTIGITLSVVGLLIADPLSVFYQNDELSSVVRVLAITFVLNGMTTQPRANLIRNLRARVIAVIDIGSAVVGLLLAVSLAIADSGVWSLVGLQIGRTVTSLIATLVADKFVPGPPDRHTSIKPFIRFGMLTFAARVPVYLSMNIDSVLIGRVLGAQSLGYYSRAYTLARLPTQQLTAPLARVMLPSLSKLQNSHASYNRALLRSQSVLTTIASIGYAVAIVFAPEIIRIALGADWNAAVPIFQVLALVGLIESSHNLTYWVFVSKGIPYQHLQYSLISRPLLIVFVVIAVPYGVMAVAWTYVTWMAIAWVLGVYWVGRSTQIPVGQILAVGAQAFLLCIALVASGLTIRQATDDSALWINIAATTLIMLLVLGGMSQAFPAIRASLLDTYGTLEYFRHPGKVKSSP